MDSYEYYLLYHKDSRSFINALTENNCEILIALKKLITNQKLKFDTEKSEVFQKVWNFMQNCETNEKLDEVLEALLTADRQETVKYWLSRQWACFDKNQPKNVLNVTAILVKKIVLDAYSTSYLLDISSHLIDILLVDSNHQTDALHILKFIIEKSLTIQAQILQNILKKCLGRSDILALQCLCNFFDKICEENIEINLNDFLLKFFQNSAPKQGIFIIKTLVHKKKLNAQDEESFKKFTIILEALEENQSHLILPSFSLLKTLKFTENFKSFWFILVQMILSHENSLIRNWGLNFVLDCSDYEFNDEEITSILSALNATYLFDDDLKPISLKHLQKFICRNWAKVFRSFEKIDWASVPCYNILKSTVVSFSDEYIDSDFVNILHKQIENIPKRVKNLVIRSGVQRFFEELTLETVKFLGITPMIPVLLNLESFESLKKCFQFMQPGEYDVIFNGKQPANFIKPALEVVADNTSLEEMIYICKNFKNREKLLIETYCKLNKYGELKRETELVMLIEQVQVNQNCVEINNENVKAIELGLKSLKTPKVLQEKVSKFMEELEVTLPFNLEAYFNLLKVMMELEFEIPSDVLENVEDKKFFHPVPPVLYCNLMMLQTASFNNSDYIYYLEHMKNTNDIKFACKAIKKLMESRNENLQIGFQYLTSALDNMLDQILRDDKRTEHVAELTRIFLMLAEIPRNPISNQRDFKDVATTYLSLLLEKLNVNDKAKVQNEIFKNAETTMIFDEKSNLRDWLKCLLVEKMIETDILTKEQQ